VKGLSIPVRIIAIVYLVVLFFMLITAPTTLGPMKLPETDYGVLFVNILALTIMAVLALVVLSLLKKDRHNPTG
jgi:hypothetical protein